MATLEQTITSTTRGPSEAKLLIRLSRHIRFRIRLGLTVMLLGARVMGFVPEVVDEE